MKISLHDVIDSRVAKWPEELRAKVPNRHSCPNVEERLEAFKVAKGLTEEKGTASE